VKKHFQNEIEAATAKSGVESQIAEKIQTELGAIIVAAWMTRKQIADRYQISLRCVDNWTEDGRLPRYKIGKIVRYDPVECDKSLRAFWFPAKITN
jgi:hypothetical protein